jgi:hypothetical protein
MRNRCFKQIKNGSNDYEIAQQLIKEEGDLEENFS